MVVSTDQSKARTGRTEHGEVRHGPVRAVVHEEIRLAAAVEIRDVGHVIVIELPARYRAVVASDQPKTTASIVG